MSDGASAWLNSLPSRSIGRPIPSKSFFTSCPSAVNNRLTQGERAPVSSAMRFRGIRAKVCFTASGVVGSFRSRMI